MTLRSKNAAPIQNANPVQTNTTTVTMGMTGVRRRLFWMVIAALAVRLAVMAFVYPRALNPARDHWRFGGEAGRIARSLATGQGYSSPYFANTGPTAWLAPVFPLLLAGVFKIFGVYTKGAALAILSFDCLLSALTCIPVFLIARRTFGGQFGERAAKWAGWIWVFFPYSINFATSFIWDTTLSTLLMALLFLAALKLAEPYTQCAGLKAAATHSPSSAWPKWFAFGAFAGFAALSDPVILSVAPFLTLWALWRQFKYAPANVQAPDLDERPHVSPQEARAGRELQRQSGVELRSLESGGLHRSPQTGPPHSKETAESCREGRASHFATYPRNDLRALFQCASVCLLGVILVLSPWFVRNYRTFHKFIPLRSGFWLEVYCGNNAANTDRATDLRPAGYHPSDSAREWNQYQRLGELSYMELKKKEALAFLSTHKMLYTEQILRRVVWTWTGFWSLNRTYLRDEPADPGNIVFCTLLSVLAFFGLHRAWRERGAEDAIPYIIAFCFFPLVYYFTHLEEYYRAPLDPMLVVVAAGTIASLKGKTKHEHVR